MKLSNKLKWKRFEIPYWAQLNLATIWKRIMKWKWPKIFNQKNSSHNLKVGGSDEEYYDKYADFYYSNIINSLILFTLKTEELEKLASPVFNPLTELESEIDYAFTHVCFETVFRNGLIAGVFKDELLSFKKKTDEIPVEIWEWDQIDNHNTWIETRNEANSLLERLGVTSRNYSEDYTTVYDNNGRITKKGKNCS